jgi:hypothetical protein
MPDAAPHPARLAVKPPILRQRKARSARVYQRSPTTKPQLGSHPRPHAAPMPEKKL